MARPVLILSHARRLSASVVFVFGEVAIGNPFKSWTISPPVSRKFEKCLLLKYLSLILFWNLCAFRIYLECLVLMYRGHDRVRFDDTREYAMINFDQQNPWELDNARIASKCFSLTSIRL